MLKAHRYLPALALALGVLGTMPACAAHVYGTTSVSYSPDYQRRAYEYGYRDGRNHGWDDIRHRRDFAYWRVGDYRDADNGYHRGDGDKGIYRDGYRRGFQTGYSEAFNQGRR